ncbi:MAG TPA: hypothetical protein PK307_07235 [Spirochaetota bacterium]|nr:hypothetical protein [Spirochaetota bacterium]
MRIRTAICAIMTAALALAAVPAGASGAGSRAAYIRGGWVGADYVAMGRTAEVLCDDVYSIYWNPAGLTELRYTQVTTEKEIRDKAEKGRVDDISEDDLIRFSEEEKSFSVQLGVTGALLDEDRTTGFVGAVINLPVGVFGIGAYTIVSTGIDRRDYSGVKTGELTYAGSACYLSYGVSLGVASLGVTAKGLWEKLGNTNYVGGGVDIGTQVYVLPFLKIGFVVQDLGAGLYPVEQRYGVRKTYDLGYPTLRLGIALITNRNFTLSVSGIKHLEQKTFGYGIGVRYDIVKYVSIFLGMQDLAFSTGAAIHVSQFDVSYAFTIDNINYGYNHVVSMQLLF